MLSLRMDVMIDIEGLATGPETTILTIAAQEFDPLRRECWGRDYYVRVDLESQEGRTIEQGTIDWWASQPESIREEAFAEHDRVPLRTALEGLHRMAWHAKRIWAQGPTYDMNILEHAFKSLGMPLPWRYYSVRDSRTLFSLCPDLEKYPASHHALEDCRRQCLLLWDSLEKLKIKEIS
jgi:exodeoxyribonuclease VIII